MSQISSIIDVFRMQEISAETRCKIIIQLGGAVNDSLGMNITEALVYELVKQLSPAHEILNNEHYLRFITPN